MCARVHFFRHAVQEPTKQSLPLLTDVITGYFLVFTPFTCLPYGLEVSLAERRYHQTKHHNSCNAALEVNKTSLWFVLFTLLIVCDVIYQNLVVTKLKSSLYVTDDAYLSIQKEKPMTLLQFIQQYIYLLL